MTSGEWKQIPDFSKYEVSTSGNVRRCDGIDFLKQRKKVSGYWDISLVRDDGVVKKLSVHKLVADVFIPNPENKPTVNHIDWEKDNNDVTNLEHATVEEQNRHKRKQKEEHTNSIRAVWKLDAVTRERLELFPSIKAASIAVSGDERAKTKIVAVALKRTYTTNGNTYERKSAFGFAWEYDNDTPINGEIWRDIDPDLVQDVTGYQISSEGRIRNSTGRVGLPYKNAGHDDGYYWLSVGPNQYQAHVLIAKVFLPNFFQKKCVNHKNGKKGDYRLWNLEYSTPRENSQHAHDTGLNTSSKKVAQYKDGVKIAEFDSCVKAAAATGIGNGGIGKAAGGKAKHAGGFVWKFV